MPQALFSVFRIISLCLKIRELSVHCTYCKKSPTCSDDRDPQRALDMRTLVFLSLTFCPLLNFPLALQLQVQLTLYVKTYLEQDRQAANSCVELEWGRCSSEHGIWEGLKSFLP